MKGSTTLWLVAQREMRQRLRSRSFLVSTVALVLLIIGGGLISRLVGPSGPAKATVAVTATDPAKRAQLGETLVEVAKHLDIAITVEPVSAAAAARSFSAHDVDAVLDADAGTARVEKDASTRLTVSLQQAWASSSLERNLVDVGLDRTEVQRALTVVPLDLQEISAHEKSGSGVAMTVGMGAAVLLFLALQFYGGFILMGVIEEKVSSVVEVLLARVPATRLLAGKVLGIGVVAVAQFAIALAAAVAALSIARVDVPAEAWAALPWTMVWFIGGFSLYAFLFAMAGALVSRQEDAQSALVPIMVVLMLAYLAVFTLAGDTGGTTARVLSVLPPFAPLLMPLRIATGSATWYEIAIALVLLAGAIWASATVSARVYIRLVLRRGSRVGWLEALRGAR